MIAQGKQPEIPVMKKIFVPALLTACAMITILSPWSGSALARVSPSAETKFTPPATGAGAKPEFSFSRGGYRHAMPTWRH